jgi:hypothetical protein
MVCEVQWGILDSDRLGKKGDDIQQTIRILVRTIEYALKDGIECEVAE